MPKVQSSIPKNLRPYVFHGVDLQWREGDKEAIGECPFCGRDKFSVEIETGKCKCWGCSEETMERGGNAYVFIRKLSEVGCALENDYVELCGDRDIIHADTLSKWRVFKSPTTLDWIVPGYNEDGNLNQLYRYGRILLPTPELKHQLFGVNLYDAKKPMVFLCEGPWDAISLWEALSILREDEAGLLSLTSNVSKSLLADSNVLAVPGCQTFFEKWMPLFAGKIVNLMYDSDHPKPNPNNPEVVTPPTGYRCMQRVAEIMSKSATPPETINYLNWGVGGYDLELPSGTDVRDILGRGGKLSNNLQVLLSLLEPVPSEWLAESMPHSSSTAGLECLPCDSYKTMITAWRKALKWTEGLDRALSVMLASVASTKILGDQLWVKIIGPAGCGKSTLSEAISVARQYIYPKDTFTGLISGYQTDKDGSENLSLVDKLHNMTLLINDGDTIMQLPNLPQVLSQLRAFYGRNLRSQFRNKMSKDHEGINTTIIICGTSSLKGLDTSELGQRFLDCVIMGKIDDEHEDDILWRVANRSDRNTSMEADGKPETFNEPALTEAMQLTGGYVCYLRKNAVELLSAIDNPEWAMKLCTRLGKFVAFMRARPSTRQTENAEREFAARLVGLHVRLAKCLAVVLNLSSVNAEVMHRVTQVAMDTGRGHALEIVEDIYESNEGCTAKGLSQRTNHPESLTGSMLRFLRQIDVVKRVRIEETGLIKWQLMEGMTKLYEDVHNPVHES